MKKNNKEVLEKTYELFYPFSSQYEVDFKRFLVSLDLLSNYHLIEGKRILDVGSGIGIMAITLKNLGAQVTIVDKFIFPDELKNCYTISNFDKLKHIWDESNIEVIRADIAKDKLPFNDNYFDIVTCDATIEHLDTSPKIFFEEVRRILKDNGLFLVTTPNLANLLRRLRFFLLGRSPHWNLKDFFESGSNFRGHRREFTLDEVSKMLEWSSFSILQKKNKNVFFNPNRFFHKQKIFAQISNILSWPFSSMREMIYVLAKKCKICAR